MRFNNFAVIIFKTLLNNYVNFKFHKSIKDKKLIINIFILSDIFKIEF